MVGGDRQRGDKNPNYKNPKNYKHSEESRQKIKNKKQGCKRPDMLGVNNVMHREDIRKKVSEKMSGANNHFYNKKPWNYGIGVNSLSDFKKYLRMVYIFTRKHVNKISNYDKSKRKRAGVPGAHHVDHIIPIRKGFKENIPPYIIGDIENLQFITWEENNNRRELYRKHK